MEARFKEGGGLRHPWRPQPLKRMRAYRRRRRREPRSERRACPPCCKSGFSWDSLFLQSSVQDRSGARKSGGIGVEVERHHAQMMTRFQATSQAQAAEVSSPANVDTFNHTLISYFEYFELFSRDQVVSSHESILISNRIVDRKMRLRRTAS